MNKMRVKVKRKMEKIELRSEGIRGEGIEHVRRGKR